MELKCIDIKKNDYKLQAAFKKPWYMSNRFFYRKIRKFAQDLPNYKLSRFHKYILLDIYFDDKGFDLDSEKVEAKSYYDKECGIFSVHFVDHSRIVNIWI